MGMFDNIAKSALNVAKSITDNAKKTVDNTVQNNFQQPTSYTPNFSDAVNNFSNNIGNFISEPIQEFKGLTQSDLLSQLPSEEESEEQAKNFINSGKGISALADILNTSQNITKNSLSNSIANNLVGNFNNNGVKYVADSWNIPYEDVANYYAAADEDARRAINPIAQTMWEWSPTENATTDYAKTLDDTQIDPWAIGFQNRQDFFNAATDEERAKTDAAYGDMASAAFDVLTLPIGWGTGKAAAPVAKDIARGVAEELGERGGAKAILGGFENTKGMPTNLLTSKSDEISRNLARSGYEAQKEASKFLPEFPELANINPELLFKNPGKVKPNTAPIAKSNTTPIVSEIPEINSAASNVVKNTAKSKKSSPGFFKGLRQEIGDVRDYRKGRDLPENFIGPELPEHTVFPYGLYDESGQYVLGPSYKGDFGLKAPDTQNLGLHFIGEGRELSNAPSPFTPNPIGRQVLYDIDDVKAAYPGIPKEELVQGERLPGIEELIKNPDPKLDDTDLAKWASDIVPFLNDEPPENLLSDFYMAMEGGLITPLAAALYGETTFNNDNPMNNVPVQYNPEGGIVFESVDLNEWAKEHGSIEDNPSAYLPNGFAATEYNKRAFEEAKKNDEKRILTDITESKNPTYFMSDADSQRSFDYAVTPLFRQMYEQNYASDNPFTDWNGSYDIMNDWVDYNRTWDAANAIDAPDRAKANAEAINNIDWSKSNEDINNSLIDVLRADMYDKNGMLLSNTRAMPRRTQAVYRGDEGDNESQYVADMAYYLAQTEEGRKFANELGPAADYANFRFSATDPQWQHMVDAGWLPYYQAEGDITNDHHLQNLYRDETGHISSDTATNILNWLNEPANIFYLDEAMNDPTSSTWRNFGGSSDEIISMLNFLENNIPAFSSPFDEDYAKNVASLFGYNNENLEEVLNSLYGEKLAPNKAYYAALDLLGKQGNQYQHGGINEAVLNGIFNKLGENYRLGKAGENGYENALDSGRTNNYLGGDYNYFNHDQYQVFEPYMDENTTVFQNNALDTLMALNPNIGIKRADTIEAERTAENKSKINKNKNTPQSFVIDKNNPNYLIDQSGNYFVDYNGNPTPIVSFY